MMFWLFSTLERSTKMCAGGLSDGVQFRSWTYKVCKHAHSRLGTQTLFTYGSSSAPSPQVSDNRHRCTTTVCGTKSFCVPQRPSLYAAPGHFVFII
jgi:hypothetical protein